jgi:hypothetical protein
VRRIAAFVGVAAGLAMLTLTASASVPAGGTLSRSIRSLSWTGGPFTVTYPTSDFECLGGASDGFCDHYKLKINMGEGAKVKVSIVGSPSGLEVLQGPASGPNDFDLFVYDADGNLVGSSQGTTGRESVTFTQKARLRGRPYEVRVVPFIILPGATYKGTAAALTYVK